MYCLNVTKGVAEVRTRPLQLGGTTDLRINIQDRETVEEEEKKSRIGEIRKIEGINEKKKLNTKEWGEESEGGEGVQSW